jgi:hypothetical protein
MTEVEQELLRAPLIEQVYYAQFMDQFKEAIFEKIAHDLEAIKTIKTIVKESHGR